jgi:hypothetical protein
MIRVTRGLIFAGAAALTISCAGSGTAAPRSAAVSEYRMPLSSPDELIVIGVEARAAEYSGKQAVRLIEGPGNKEGDTLALLPKPSFQDGTIDVDVVGRPRPGSFEGARGFVGVLFRSSSDASSYECIYLRPTNGRADDQLRRNHSTQYISEPGFEFDRLRKEAPGVYESYVDLEPGVWTHMRIEVSGARARLFVNGSAQPVLIVNDLKRGVSSGQVGLWIGTGTEAFFSSLQIRVDDKPGS